MHLLKCSNIAHFLFNVQTFSLLKPILAKTTPPPPLFSSFSFPVKTILLFNPTGSTRGRLKREWAANALLLTRCSTPPPSLHRQLLSNAWKRKEERRKRVREERKKNNNHKRRNPHISHIIPAGESSCDSGIPCWFKHSRRRAAGPGWSTSTGRTDNSHSPDSSPHLNKGDRRSLRRHYCSRVSYF